MQTGNTDLIYKSDLYKACFQHDMTYVKSKRLNQAKFWEKKHLKLQVTQNMMVIQKDYFHWYTSFVIKNLLAVVLLPCQIINLQTNFTSRLLENLREVYSPFRENIWGVDLADMESLSIYNRVIRYLLCEIDLLSKYAWVVSLKGKKGISIVDIFQNIISKGRKPNKILVEQGSEFKNYLFKRFLKNDNVEMYSS